MGDCAHMLKSNGEVVAMAGEGVNDALTASRILMVCGWVLIFAGLVHVAVWLVSEQPWEGTVSWRKPALFGMSGGLTLVSLGFLQRSSNFVEIRPVRPHGEFHEASAHGNDRIHL